VNFKLSLVVSITVTCYPWASSTGDHINHMWRHHRQAATVGYFSP